MKKRTITLKSLTLGSLTAFGLSLAALPLHAQEEEYGYTPPATQAESAEISEEMLEKFAEASSEVREVQEEYSAEIQATQDAAEAQTLREEAQEKMISAVEDSGLSVTEYNLISQRLQSDPELEQRLNDLER